MMRDFPLPSSVDPVPGCPCSTCQAATARGRELLERSIQQANIAFHWRGARVEITPAGRAALTRCPCGQMTVNDCAGECGALVDATDDGRPIFPFRRLARAKIEQFRPRALDLACRCGRCGDPILLSDSFTIDVCEPGAVTRLVHARCADSDAAGAK